MFSLKKIALITAAAALLGSGPVLAQPDLPTQLTEARQEGSIWTAFALNKHLSPFKIDVGVEQGTATLKGKVENEVDRELAERMATPAYLIDGAEDMQQGWFDGVERIGITAGASAPEVLVRGVIQQLQAWGATGADELAGREENITFSMPKELRVKSLL
ncbi:BON domain-containing protein [Pseudomonas syringae]|uniref:BON domain-containing protein n=1 Tax=Pseudomonas syringae TaxID=317 RepID=UPI0010720C0F|nr:BON domain-containing protein [Pseudomonas syringae]